MILKRTLPALFLLSSLLAFGIGWAPKTASVKFYIKNAGVTVDGSLKGLVASVNFDPADLAGSSISATVKVNTIKTGIDSRDEHLVKAEYFNAAAYPTIKMKSTSFTKVAGTSFSGKFNLTIKGKTKSVTVPFTFTEKDGKGVFSGSFKIDRLDFGVGESSWVLSDDVRVKIKLNTLKK